MNVTGIRSAGLLFGRYMDRLSAPLAGFWSWWSAEIYEVLPQTLRDAIDRWCQCLFVAVDGNDLRLYVGSWKKIREVARTDPQSGAASGCPLPTEVLDTILLMPLDKVLSLRISLPFSAEDTLEECIARELDHWTPYGAANVYFDYRITGRNLERKELYLELAYSPRREVDRYLDVVTERGLEVSVVTSRRLYAPGVKMINLLPPELRPGRRRNALHPNPVLAAVTGLLLAITIANPVVQKSRAIAEVAARAEVAEENAAESDRLRRGLERMAATSRFLVEKKESAVMAVELIDEISRILPDDTWISYLEISETELRLQGESEESASLIGIIDASPLFERAQFRSPVVQVAGRNADKFVLSADVIQAIER